MAKPDGVVPGSIYLFRHGETEWSLSGQHTGTTDLPLLPEGEEAARELREILQHRTFERVLSSPLQRARRTAELAGLTDIETEPLLREWDYGAYEGVTTADISARLGRPWEVFVDGVDQNINTIKRADWIPTFTAQTEIRVKAGNAGAVEVSYNQRPFERLGSPGAVVTKTYTPASD